MFATAPITENDLLIDITEDEILADLNWPGPPPGEWPVEAESGDATSAGEPFRLADAA
jgi:hypothetical protein